MTSAPVRPPARRTKIVATIGPASWQADTVAEMVDAGMDMARIPLAHGTIQDAVRVLRTIRSAAPDVGVLADLPGPKIRAASFPEGGAAVVAGSPIELVTEDATHPSSSSSRIAVAHEDLIANLQPGDRVALGDGGVALTIESRVGDRVIARVRSGGLLQGRPGVTAPASRSALSTPTDDDLEKLAVLVAEEVDVVAVSFVNRAADMEIVRSAAGPGPLLCAKIETPEGVADLDSILAVSESVMVARGDLGVRIPLEDVPHVQKQVIRAGIRYGRPVITATQMLESMISSPIPTRAEATDVANAVFDGTSAVMLSGETAIGAHAVEAVATMAAIAQRAEDNFDYGKWGSGLDAQEVAGHETEQVTATITAAAWRASVEQGSPAIIACTRSGATARAIARFRPAAQVIAATPLEITARQLRMSWGVESVIVKESYSTDEIVWFAVQEAVEQRYAKRGDVVVVLAGSPDEPEPVTDTLRLVRVH
ncbi:MAG: pyruvate kinase [Acidimicrobiaceae bacterium]|nr:pyruvate kinase [Acidimicrobiaceae bacterium]MBO0746938.1 pyruvate kinase [Acidimicrobiaceae bacterium]